MSLSPTRYRISRSGEEITLSIRDYAGKICLSVKMNRSAAGKLAADLKGVCDHECGRSPAKAEK